MTDIKQTIELLERMTAEPAPGEDARLDADELDAVLFAIKALKERPRGEWITIHFEAKDLNAPEKSKLDFVKCPFCETIHQGRRNYCSRCGADMREEAST